MFIISTRKPRIQSDSEIPVVQINPLSIDSTKRLLSLLASDNNLTITSAQIFEIADYVAGYPPSAYFVIRQAKSYGIEFVVRDKTHIIEFHRNIFLKYLEKQSLNKEELKLLQILAAYSPLPLSVLVNFFEIKLEMINEILIKLIDLSLIITTEDGYYRIADPVANAVVGVYGYPTVEESEKVAQSIFKYLNEAETSSPLLLISRAMFRAAKWAKDEEIAKKAIRFSNDLIKLTESFYHDRNYMEAIKFGNEAINERPKSINARSYLIRALIHEERYNDAEAQIKEIKKFASPSEEHYLRGFLERRRRNFKQAIEEYELASKFGRKGVAINRELASCYHKLGNNDRALKYVEEALKPNYDNAYVLNLWAQIATEQRNEDTANKAIDRLHAIGDEAFYYHRLSKAEIVFRSDWGAAREAAKKAIESVASPHFELIAHLANCEIVLGNHLEATKLLDRLDKDYKNVHHNIRLSLRCRLEINKRKYKNALELAEEIKDKNTNFYRKIMYDALKGELEFSALDDEVRLEYEDRISKLREDMQEYTEEHLIPPELN